MECSSWSALCAAVGVLCWLIPSRTGTPDMSNKNIGDLAPVEQGASVSRRGFLKLAGASGLATAAGGLASASRAAAAAVSPDGTPEQIHLTWGKEPSAEVV